MCQSIYQLTVLKISHYWEKKHTQKRIWKILLGQANIIEHNRDTLPNTGELILFKHQRESRGKQTLGQLHLKVLLTTMSFISTTWTMQICKSNSFTNRRKKEKKKTHRTHTDTHVYIRTHPKTWGTSYLWIVKIREGCYAFDVLNSELVLGVRQWDWGY